MKRKKDKKKEFREKKKVGNLCRKLSQANATRTIFSMMFQESLLLICDIAMFSTKCRYRVTFSGASLKGCNRPFIVAFSEMPPKP